MHENSFNYVQNTVLDVHRTGAVRVLDGDVRFGCSACSYLFLMLFFVRWCLVRGGFFVDFGDVCSLLSLASSTVGSSTVTLISRPLRHTRPLIEAG